VEPKTLKPTLQPTPRPTPMPVLEPLVLDMKKAGGEKSNQVDKVVVNAEGGGGGLAGWAIAIIVIIALLMLCCISYFLLVSCFTKRNKIEKTHNNIYLGHRSQDAFSYGGSRGRDRNMHTEEDKSRGRESRLHRSPPSHRSNGITDVQIVLNNPQDPKFGDDYFTVNTYGTRPNRKRRDPTMYIPGEDHLPDPDTDTLMIQDGGDGARYMEDPPLKPKRDPTMYFDEGYDASEASSRPKRDPTMYVDGQQDPSMYGDGESSYCIDPYGSEVNGEESEYDQFGFRSSEQFRSEENTEHTNAGRDPTYYTEHEEMSFQTRDAKKSGGVESHIDVSFYEESFQTKEATKPRGTRSKKSKRKDSKRDFRMSA